MENLDNIIKVVKKVCIKQKEFQTGTDPNFIAHEVMIQQGVSQVIKVLAAINEGSLRIEDVLQD